MLIPFLGKLSVAQAITASDEDSENVMEIMADGAGRDYGHITDAWWIVDTNVIAAGDSADTFKFSLVLAKEAALTNVIEVAAVTITGIADIRLATAGRHIMAINVGKMLKDILDTDGSDYEFLGQQNTLSAGATISIDSVVSGSEPHTESHRMSTESGVGVPSNP